MPPDIRYAKTANGDHVAYTVSGEGPPLVMCPAMELSIEWAFENPACRLFLERLASFSRLVLYDKRGTGHSDAIAGELTLDQRVEDVLAVMDAALVDRAAIFGCSEGGTTSLLLAARQAERVEKLITWGTPVRAVGRLGEGAPFVAIPEVAALWPDLLSATWGTTKDWAMTDLPPPIAQTKARLQQLCASPAMGRRMAELDLTIDVRPVLGAVRAPMLVMHRSGDVAVGVDHAKYIAASVPGAQYVELAGTEHFPWRDDQDRVIAEIEEFMTGFRSEAIADRVIAVVMFGDIVSSTEHASKLSDDRWKDVVRKHDVIVRDRVERSRGRFLRTTGDGFVATFDGASRAIRCGKEIIAAIAELGLEMRVGLHAGEIELTSDDIGGIGVHIAERVAKECEPGQVWVSSTVRDVCDGSHIAFDDRGEFMLKGVSQPWRLFRAKLP